MTLNELLIVAAAPRLLVTVTLSRTLTARIGVDSRDRGQWEDLAANYGDYIVREVRPGDDALCVSVTRP